MGKKDLHQTLKKLQREGWQVRFGKKHVKLRAPWGQLFTCSSSPGAQFANRELERDIRRYGKHGNKLLSTPTGK